MVFLQDLSYAWRRLRRAPAFTTLAVLTLALGMGAATSIFSVVDAVLLKPLPFREADRLLVIWEKNRAQNRFRLFVSPVNFLAWQQRSRTLQDMAAMQDARLNLTGGPNGHMDPEELKAERVSASLFPLLGVQATVGRTFRPEEDQPGHANFAVLSHSLWQRRFAADRDIAGKTIRLRDQPYTVLGVLPRDFAVLESGVDLYLPLALNAADRRAGNNRFLTVFARRRAGLDEVRQELEAVGEQMEQAMPVLNHGWRPSVFVLQEELVGNVRRSLWVLLGAVGCLLLMACVNVANLLLARGASQRKELALRSAMGAGRARIMAQLFTESLLMGLGGGAAGLVLAAGAIYVLAHGGPASVPRLAQASLDLRVFAFTLAVSVATGVLFGVAPALQAVGGSVTAVLNEGGRGGSQGRTARRVRNALVVTQVALAVVVLIGAGLLMQSFLRLRAVDPGFRPQSVWTVRLPLSGGRNSTPERRIAFFSQLTPRIAVLPGVVSASAVSSLPLNGLGTGATFIVEGRPAPSAEQRPQALARSVMPAYFQTMKIPLVSGREFTNADVMPAPAVVVVNQTLAHRFWPQGGAVGGRLTIEQGGRVAEIVGIVGDVKSEGVDREDWPVIYSPYAQSPISGMTLVVRTAGAPEGLVSAVRKTVLQLDAEQPLADVRTMEQVVNLAVAEARFHTTLLGSFAAIAFLLAAVGIFSVISYDVNQRTNEIGIRMALGAQPEEVRSLILGQGARLTVYGIVAGWIAAAVITRWMKSMLFGVSPTDIWTFGAISILLAGVALAASFVPSRRAMALDPVTALRRE
ncbi:MAG: ABC transporter permease [Candidatus Solibacter sp.]